METADELQSISDEVGRNQADAEDGAYAIDYVCGEAEAAVGDVVGQGDGIPEGWGGSRAVIGVWLGCFIAWLGIVHVVEGGHGGVETGLGGIIVADFAKDECTAFEVGEFAFPFIAVNAEFVEPIFLDAFSGDPSTGEFAGEEGVGKQAALHGENFLGGDFLLAGELHLGLARGKVQRVRVSIGDEEIVDVFVEGVVA